MKWDSDQDKAQALDNSRLLDVHKWSEHPEVNKLVDLIYDEIGSASANVNIQKKHVKVILLDLYVCWQEDPDKFVAVRRGSNAYKA